MMNYETMMKEKKAAFEKISEIMNQKSEAFQKEMTELENEQLRLQGEYRVLTELLKQEESDSEESEKDLSEKDFDAEVVD